jgi:hypothetical protein
VKASRVFDLIRHKSRGGDAVLIAFDLIELEGEDLRHAPIEHRKSTLAKLVRGPHPGIVLNEVEEDRVAKAIALGNKFPGGLLLTSRSRSLSGATASKCCEVTRLKTLFCFFISSSKSDKKKFRATSLSSWTYHHLMFSGS